MKLKDLSDNEIIKKEKEKREHLLYLWKKEMADNEKKRYENIYRKWQDLARVVLSRHLVFKMDKIAFPKRPYVKPRVVTFTDTEEL